MPSGPISSTLPSASSLKQGLWPALAQVMRWLHVQDGVEHGDEHAAADVRLDDLVVLCRSRPHPGG